LSQQFCWQHPACWKLLDVAEVPNDLQMLQWTAAGEGQRFCLYVHHTDADREWAYDRESHIGKLDKGLDASRHRVWATRQQNP